MKDNTERKLKGRPVQVENFIKKFLCFFVHQFYQFYQFTQGEEKEGGGEMTTNVTWGGGGPKGMNFHSLADGVPPNDQ